MGTILASDIWEGNREEGVAKGKALWWSYYLRRAFCLVPQSEERIAHGPTMLPTRLSGSLDGAVPGATTEHRFSPTKFVNCC